MDRVDLDRAMGDASRPSRQVGAFSSERELPERTRMFSKLFTLYPLSATQDTEGAVLAYIEETRDLPCFWLSCGLASIVREPGRRFAPSVGEIRGAAMLSIRAARRRSEGKPSQMPGADGTDPLRADREMAWIRTPVALQLARGGR